MKHLILSMLILLGYNSIFSQRAQTIAILPFQVFTSGNQPKKMTPQDLMQIKINDGLYFQNLLERNLNIKNQRTRFAKKNIRILTAEEVNGIIANNNLTVADVYQLSDAELVKMFNVDKIAKGRVDRFFNISQEASTGLLYGTAILNNISKNQTPVIDIPSSYFNYSVQFSNIVNSRNLFSSRSNMRIQKIARHILKKA